MIKDLAIGFISANVEIDKSNAYVKYGRNRVTNDINRCVHRCKQTDRQTDG